MKPAVCLLSFLLLCGVALAEAPSSSSRQRVGYIEKVKVGEQELVVEAILSPAISNTELGVLDLSIGPKKNPPPTALPSKPVKKSDSKKGDVQEEKKSASKPSTKGVEEEEEEEEHEDGGVEVLLEEEDEVDEEIQELAEAMKLQTPKSKSEKKVEYATFTLKDRLGRTGFFSLPITGKRKGLVSVRLPLCISNLLIRPEIYLSNRSKFAQELRVGRTVLAGRFVVDPSLTHSSTPNCDMDG